MPLFSIIIPVYNVQNYLSACVKSVVEQPGPRDWECILVDDGFDPGEVKTVIIGPCNDRPGATKLGNNQAITQPEADALEAIMQKGYEVEFALIKEAAIGNWKKFRGQFGY